jgi:predicted DnaQ family exonuclease/DinG family helicase
LRNIVRLLYPNSSRVKYFFKPILEYKTKHNIQVTSAGISEDIQYFQQHYNIIGEADYEIAEIDEEVPSEQISEERILKYLSNEGDLAHIIENFEERSQQKDMSGLITQAFNNSQFQIIEAGTGTGKSMAYLLPAVEYAVKNRVNNERVLVSTNTKNLQEQLFFKDIPTVFSVVDMKFKAVLLKGKSNYLCLDKWKATLTDMDHRLAGQERTRILPLMLWVEQTQTGDIAENSGFQLNQNWGLWGKLIAENNYCPGRVCKFYNECFLMKARGNARKADIIVVNHSLLFSDLVTDNSILGDYHNLIIDEAHNLEKVAGDYLGTRFNWWTFRNIYHKLYQEEPKKTGTLAQLEYRLSKAFEQNTNIERLQKQINRLKTESLGLKRIAHNFFSELNSRLRKKYQSFFNELFDMIEELKSSILSCKKRLSDLLDIFKELKVESFPFQDQIHRELISIETDLEYLYEAFDFCLKAEMENYVYWLELPLRKDSTDVSFNAVPLNVAELLKKTLYDRLKVGIFTSATMAVNDSFEYYKNRVGLNLVKSIPVRSALLGSPFNYESQILLAISDFLDDPRNERFADQLTQLIKELHQENPTGMLALFTNYSMLNLIFSQLKEHFESEKILLLAQGKSGNRTNIINQFREYKNSILFGTDSFWEGIDVPGDALELLLITKLPFDVPSDPLIAARLDQIKNSGGNPFLEYSVPEAIIKFRQGFGRLIRHKNDFGAVIVCDNRLSRMQYGKQFLESLPTAAKVYSDKYSLYEDLNNWFINKVK